MRTETQMGTETRRRTSSRIADRRAAVPITFALTNKGSPAWEDVQILWELKSSQEPGHSEALGNLILKASEGFRFQWYRRFVLGFLVFGNQMKMFLFDRSAV